MTKVNMSGWSQEQMANWQDPMLAGTGFNRPGVKPRQEAQILTQPNFQNPYQTGLGGLGGLAGNKNLQDRLKFLSTFQQGGGQHPLQTPQYPSRPKQYDVAGGFEEFGETLGGYKETLGGYGEQISGFEEQLGGFGEQFSGMEEQFGGVGEDINEINERLGGIEEGISTLKISKPEQKQNPYANMFNPFSFIGNWGGSRSRMSYR
jgi:hypothetical protein